jgi:hypothetical protein
MGVGSDQPLAEGKGVICEVNLKESEKQIPGLRNTNINIKPKSQDEFAKQYEIRKLSGCDKVNDADIWDESD